MEVAVGQWVGGWFLVVGGGGDGEGVGGGRWLRVS